MGNEWEWIGYIMHVNNWRKNAFKHQIMLVLCYQYLVRYNKTNSLLIIT